MQLKKMLIVAGAALIILTLAVLPVSIAGTVNMTATAVITSSTTETVTTNLDFGSIDLDPAGETVTINASAGAATPAVANASVVTGGTSGLITITSAVVMHVDVTYPAANITLSNGSGDTLTIVAATIAANSMYPDTGAGTNTDGTNPLLIHVGGIIVVPAGQANGTYTGTMAITINYS